jgi:NADH-quinone oxidoreductase subunit C
VEVVDEKRIVKEIKARFSIESEIKRTRRILISVDKKDLLEVSEWIKERGFKHMSAISVVDWVEAGIYELTYHVWSQKDKVLITLKTSIDREKAVIDSVITVWDRSAGIHERELHELFGVNFEGNPDLAPLFLEDWEGPAPFRKDFDWREYTREKYYDSENERERVYYT